MVPSLRLPRRTSLLEFLFLLALAFSLFYFFLLPGFHDYAKSGPLQQIKASQNNREIPLPCSLLSGANDTVVVLKTSAAEIEDRLPIHFDTTLLCYPNYLIFSDYAEKFQGYPVHDALATVDKSFRTSHPDFELWRRLQKHGPDGLEDEEIWDPERTTKDLDKWKYLPIVEQTFLRFPEKQWYIFVETGTFVFWNGLLEFLSELDAERTWFLGGNMGSGIVLSNAAVRDVVGLYRETREGWDAFTETQSSGDAVLAQALKEAGVELTPSWPVFQGRRLADMQYDRMGLWCSRTVSYAGVEKGNIAELWKFEQQWLRDNPTTPLLHRDIFTSFILPRLIIRSGRVDDWDNSSQDNATPAGNVDACTGICVADPECVQYSFEKDKGMCRFSGTSRLGEGRSGVESRWLLARVKRWGEGMGGCEGV
ncbi:hypothetical protein PRZ48_004029 [Zasmidium cellare]|uniref:Glycosyltransferase family 31 protein n=1 Tax=Zasmidium cellare TaxID=395010 RepID=A0ABR0EWP6_ZASCE|nr:hypothetical protein PRZ48_004029 [Zasmidium cellare]